MVGLTHNTFVRHANDESLVWNSRNGGCTILKNAQVIIDEIGREWRDVNDITQSVARKFECEIDDVADGVNAVLEELIGQGFVKIRSEESASLSAVSGVKSVQEEGCFSDTGEEEDDWSPHGGFYSRHKLPLELHIDLTDGCNEKCVHCYLPKGGSKYLDRDVAFKVLKEFREAQGLTVYFSGGECMLHRDFAEILRYAKSLDLNIVVMSNLTLCDERMVQLLKEIDPQFVNVSLYAVTDEIHDSITQIPGSCAKTKAAIEALQSVGVHIRIATPFMRENKNCVGELREYAKAHRVHLIADNEIFGELDQSCANQSHAIPIEEMEMFVRENSDLFYKSPVPTDRCEASGKVCDIGEARLNLDAEGKYYPCDGFHGMIIGDARNDSLMSVWQGDALDKLRELKNSDFGSCASCENRAWCKVCAMRNLNETGNMFTHAPWRCEAASIYRKVFEEK